MSDMFLEIVELEDGRIALRRADSDDDAIMLISFSDEIREQLEEECIDVAKVMLTAGIHMISDLNGKTVEPEVPDEPQDDEPRIIH